MPHTGLTEVPSSLVVSKLTTKMSYHNNQEHIIDTYDPTPLTKKQGPLDERIVHQIDNGNTLDIPRNESIKISELSKKLAKNE